jgi:hypothetical protein
VKVVGPALTCDEPDDRGVVSVWLDAADDELVVLLALHDAMRKTVASRAEQLVTLRIKTPWMISALWNVLSALAGAQRARARTATARAPRYAPVANPNTRALPT